MEKIFSGAIYVMQRKPNILPSSRKSSKNNMWQNSFEK
jgi:hypothetical protein